MRIRVFAHDSNPAVDVPLCHKSASYVDDLLRELKAFRLDARSIQLFAPKDTTLTREDPDMRCRSYSHLTGHLRATAMNEGRRGQFTIGYPIPFAYEGHLKSPRASEVNACAVTVSQ